MGEKEIQKGSIEDMLVKVRVDSEYKVKELREQGRIPEGGREVALAITKLQEARMWAGEALKELGFFDKD